MTMHLDWINLGGNHPRGEHHWTCDANWTCVDFGQSTRGTMYFATLAFEFNHTSPFAVGALHGSIYVPSVKARTDKAWHTDPHKERSWGLEGNEGDGRSSRGRHNPCHRENEGTWEGSTGCVAYTVFFVPTKSFRFLDNEDGGLSD